MTDSEKLKQIIDEIPQLLSVNITSSNVKFQAWKSKAERFLINKYGADSFEYKKFKKIPFTLSFFTIDTKAYEFVQACHDGLKIAQLTFQEYFNEMTEEGAKLLPNQQKNCSKISEVGTKTLPNQQKIETKDNTIFISHRSTDKKIADMLLDFFIGTGISRNTIFCSSLPGNDVNEKISNEVKNALHSSKINIAILSKDYYDSAYCLNEAGILWFLDSAVVIPIALPKITPDKMIGFLNDEYKIRKLDNESDITYIYDTIIDQLSISQVKASIIHEESRKLIEKYNNYIK